MRRALAASVLAATALLAGCRVAPPVPLEQDPEVAALAAAPPGDPRSGALPGVRLALGPVSESYRVKGIIPFAGTAAVASGSGVREGEAVYAWATPPGDPDELQRHFARLLGLALRRAPGDLPTIGRGSVPAPAPGEDPDAARRAVEGAECDAADQLHAPLLVHVDVLENRVRWVRREALLWVADLVLLWGGGVVPVLFVPDEAYEATVRVRVTVVHARTRERVFVGEYAGTASRDLNTFQRGVTISGLVGLHPWFLDPERGDYQDAQEALFPHALRDLDTRIARALPRALEEALDVPEVRTLVRDGTPATARTYAVVVGHNGPRATRPRPPLRFAENDAREVAEALVRSGVVGSREHLRVLTDEHATRAEILAAVRELVPWALGLDRVVVSYAGYGRTNEAGEPVLVLGGGDEALPVADLARCVGEAAVAAQRPRVVFLLDTSFGREPAGRSYRSADDPGGPEPAAATYLEPLANRALGWSVIVAAGPSESSYEIDARTPGSRHGFFTHRLLAALGGGAERDGVLATDALASYLAELVPEDVRPALQAEQNPERRGLEEPTILSGRGR